MCIKTRTNVLMALVCNKKMYIDMGRGQGEWYMNSFSGLSYPSTFLPMSAVWRAGV